MRGLEVTQFSLLWVLDTYLMMANDLLKHFNIVNFVHLNI